jgi:acyl-CoA thioesterase-1
MKSPVAVALLACLICSAQPANAAHGASSRLKTVLVLGDSLSDGFQLKRSQAYPALLAASLDAAGLNYQVINASQVGGTSDGGLGRLPPHLKHKIDIFILELGINDFFLGRPIEEIRNNLQAIIEKVKARYPDVHIIIAGMQLPNRSADHYVGAFSQMYADLAAKTHAALVPYLLQGVGGDPSFNLPDHIHPNAAGQHLLAENVWRVLEPIARDTAAKPASHER